jgi:branched-chain amino acid transport system substrate-binding protein
MTVPRLALFALVPLLLAAKLPDAVTLSFTASSPSAAVKTLDAALAQASTADRPWVMLYLAEAHRRAGEADTARALFARIVKEHAGSPARDPATLGLAVIDAGGRASGNALATLELIGDAEVPRTLEAERWLLVAAARLDERSEAARVRDALDRAARAAKGDAAQLTRVDQLRASASPAGETSAPPPPAAPAGPTDALTIEAIREALARAEWDTAARLAAEFSARFPESPQAREVAYAVKRAEARVAPDPKRVAVLLPLSGALALPGGNLRAAIELGVARSGDGVTLDVLDTAGDAATCVAKLEEAVIQRGATLVVGPLHKDEAATCGPAAQALRVPMVTLTSSEDALAAGDHVFRAFPSVEQQIDALLTEVMDVRKMQRFAVLHPTNSYSENASRAFTAAVAARGGTVMVTQTYDPSAKDFRAAAKALGRKDYTARAGEFARLRADAKRNGADPDKVVLPPLVDYEAIFLPDTYARTALVASALAFEEFPIGKFRPRRDVPPLPLLGLNAWNNDDFPRRGGAYVQDSIFVDAYDAHADTGAAEDFRADWRARGGGDPSVLEAVGFDVGRIVGAAVAAGGGLEGLRGARLTEPVAGTHGFDANRQADRTWTVLTVSRNGVSLLQPPEPTEPQAPAQ